MKLGAQDGDLEFQVAEKSTPQRPKRVARTQLDTPLKKTRKQLVPFLDTSKLTSKLEKLEPQSSELPRVAEIVV